jgi:hypothetical protein
MTEHFAVGTPPSKRYVLCEFFFSAASSIPTSIPTLGTMSFRKTINITMPSDFGGPPGWNHLMIVMAFNQDAIHSIFLQLGVTHIPKFRLYYQLNNCTNL